MTYITVKEMPQEERPRERLARVGPQSLSTAELLAIILRIGAGGENVLTMANRILSEHSGLAGLARADFNQLQEIRGLGPAKCAQLLAAFEIGRRLTAEAPEERFQIRSPADAARILIPLIGHKEQEHFVVLYLDTRNRVNDQESNRTDPPLGARNPAAGAEQQVRPIDLQYSGDRQGQPLRLRRHTQWFFGSISFRHTTRKRAFLTKS